MVVVVVVGLSHGHGREGGGFTGRKWDVDIFCPAIAISLRGPLLVFDPALLLPSAPAGPASDPGFITAGREACFTPNSRPAGISHRWHVESRDSCSWL